MEPWLQRSLHEGQRDRDRAEHGHVQRHGAHRDVTEQLAAVLTYHVIAGKVMAADVVQMNRATTVSGNDVAISAADGNVRINGATIVATDIETSNGVIHVIDRVLLP